MIWPQLVRTEDCHTPIRVILTSGVSRDGTPAEHTVFDGKCNYSEKSRQILDAERRLVQLEATALFPGDIAPEHEDIEGYAVIGGGAVTRTIHRAERARNPDGTVNFTRLDLM